ncbi:MAG: hypothetical protein CO106_05460, partial [Deltaproteobacteria bacterium CG_4_9_14_3_um_filter_44_9]
SPPLRCGENQEFETDCPSGALLNCRIIDYLKEKEEMEATLEILSSPELMAQMEEAEKPIKKGKLDDFVPWEKVKRNVQSFSSQKGSQVL